MAGRGRPTLGHDYPTLGETALADSRRREEEAQTALDGIRRLAAIALTRGEQNESRSRPDVLHAPGRDKPVGMAVLA